MTNWLQNSIGISPEVQINILISLIIVFGIIFLRYLLVKLVIQNIDDISQRYQWRKLSLYISVFIILLFLAFDCLGLIGSVGTFLGLMTAGFVHIWHEIPLLITFESDWKKAKKILTDVINKNTVQIT